VDTNVKKNDHSSELTDDVNDGRSRLVRVRRIVDSSIFNGWGIKL
jgi:hypothetical protein